MSIGLPVYNGEKFIRVALDSLLAQTFTDFELIISELYVVYSQQCPILIEYFT
ncbi:glycosyltransferase [Dendronalium sp. ChiSLP03b]|uniref:glycosyltransferase n=1 Tax=Dendronalium sp. ChiSLP03b TaxID=3075381 RepID=UPI003919586D